MRILLVFAVVTALANAASTVATVYSDDGHMRAERVLGEEYGERCVEYATFEECIKAFGEGGV